MGYLNPVLQYGIEKFCEEAAQAGVDGLILPDLPLQEFESEYKISFDRNNLKNIFLISPTTSDSRIKEIDALATGFIYAVSASSTTGAKGSFSNEQISYFKKLQSLKLNNPFLIGFGISSKETFGIACDYSSGAIVGSAFINAIESATDLPSAINDFVSEIRG
jgi:tryptophan synthase alpha chain